MGKELECKYMGLTLKSPFVLSSLTLVSKVSIETHIDYFSFICGCGAGAIVLPSINPKVLGNSKNNDTIADCLAFTTGLRKNTEMGFSVLGPTEPNIISTNYGLELAKQTKNKLNVPVIGSVVNLGSKQEILEVVNSLSSIGVDAIELNYSCPNILDKGDEIESLISIIKLIKQSCTIPISLKISPNHYLLNNFGELNNLLDGITLSNAYIGLIPPVIDSDNGQDFYSPFPLRDQWSPCGVYGTYEKILYDLFRFISRNPSSKVNVACVGGIVSGVDAIQALLLGADVVELSSAVLWNGGRIFTQFNQELLKYLYYKNCCNVEEIKGKSLHKIKACADALMPPPKRYMSIDSEKCICCKECYCTNRLCLAISQKQGEQPKINKELCSGCGFCCYLCIKNAINIIIDK